MFWFNLIASTIILWAATLVLNIEGIGIFRFLALLVRVGAFVALCTVLVDSGWSAGAMVCYAFLAGESTGSTAALVQQLNKENAR